MDQKEMLFSGSAGSLHGYYCGTESATSIALVLPPHPKYGGTMKNKVVKVIFDSFASKNFATLRMNFRGVGYSEGEISFDEADLLKDANAAIEWLQSTYPLAESFWIGGFSSGAWLGLNIMMRRPEISGFVAVAPPFKLHDFSFLSPCMVPGLLLQGSQDALSDMQEVAKITNPIDARVKKFRLRTIEDGDYKLSSDHSIKSASFEINDYLSFALKEENDDIIVSQDVDSVMEEKVALEEEIV